VIAAASLLQWAENARLASRTPEAVQEAFYSWYDTLDADEQESFAEAWTMIEPDALSLLSDKDSMTGRIEDAGLDPDTLPGCTLKSIKEPPRNEPGRQTYLFNFINSRII